MPVLAGTCIITIITAIVITTVTVTVTASAIAKDMV
jgi:hypothetical protein